MVKINWTQQSKSDLVSIADFIAQGSKKYAVLQIRRIRERVHQLANFPKSGRIVPELDNPRIRELVQGNYRIIYLFPSPE